jgi:hypothetical protein
MKIGRRVQKDLAHPKEADPREKEAHSRGGAAQERRENESLVALVHREPAKARSADQPGVVLNHTLATKEPAALGTPGRGFTPRVMQTNFEEQTGHRRDNATLRFRMVE